MKEQEHIASSDGRMDFLGRADCGMASRDRVGLDTRPSELDLVHLLGSLMQQIEKAAPRDGKEQESECSHCSPPDCIDLRFYREAPKGLGEHQQPVNDLHLFLHCGRFAGQSQLCKHAVRLKNSMERRRFPAVGASKIDCFVDGKKCDDDGDRDTKSVDEERGRRERSHKARDLGGCRT